VWLKGWHAALARRGVASRRAARRCLRVRRRFFRGGVRSGPASGWIDWGEGEGVGLGEGEGVGLGEGEGVVLGEGEGVVLGEGVGSGVSCALAGRARRPVRRQASTADPRARRRGGRAVRIEGRVVI
jgi:hypothetical protein